MWRAATGEHLLTVNPGGNVGIGTSEPSSKLDVSGEVRADNFFTHSEMNNGRFAFCGAYVEGTFQNWRDTGRDAVCKRVAGTKSPHVGYGVASGPNIESPVIWMYGVDGNAFEVRALEFGQTVPEGKTLFSVAAGDEMTRVRILKIVGGADMAEPFDMSEPEIPKGAVVIIDEQSPGKLKLSQRAYDTRVAGIVSGANGVKPGLTLSQEGAFLCVENLSFIV